MKHNFHAKVLADSLSPEGVRLTTMEWTFPRYILAEVNTHRSKSSNAASSRAIPYKKQRANIVENPFIPIFQKNQSGMQSSADLSGDEMLAARMEWLRAMSHAVEAADALTGVEPRTFVTPLEANLERVKRWMGNLWNGQKVVSFEDGSRQKDLALDIHKQFASRLVEPFMWTTIIISATDWNNLFALRYHPAAEPSFQRIARHAWQALQNSRPTPMQYGGWHLPMFGKNGGHKDDVRNLHEYVHKTYGLRDIDMDFARMVIETARKMAVGRCARISYLNHEGIRSIEDDISLHDRLSAQRPGHWSPFEHVATPAKPEDMSYKLAQLEVNLDVILAGTIIKENETPKYMVEQEFQKARIVPKKGEVGYCGNFRGWKQYRKFFEDENIKEFFPS